MYPNIINIIYCRGHVADINFFLSWPLKIRFLERRLEITVLFNKKTWRLRLQHGLKSRYALLTLALSKFCTFLFFNQCSVFHHNTTYLHASAHAYKHMEYKPYSITPVQKESYCSCWRTAYHCRYSTTLHDIANGEVAPVHNIKA